MNEAGISESRTGAAVSSDPGSPATIPSDSTLHYERKAPCVNSFVMLNSRSAVMSIPDQTTLKDGPASERARKLTG